VATQIHDVLISDKETLLFGDLST